MDNTYPQYPDSSAQGDGSQQGANNAREANMPGATPEAAGQRGQAYGPAFGPFDGDATAQQPTTQQPAAQQPTRVNAAGQGAHFSGVAAGQGAPVPGNTTSYAAQGAYQQAYRNTQGPQPPQQGYPQPQQQSSQQGGFGYRQGGAPAGGFGYGEPQRAQAYQAPQQPQGQGPQLHREAPREGVRPSVERKQHVGLKAVACGLLGGVLGSAGVVWALSATGNLGKTTVVSQGTSAGQSISIAANSEDVTISEAVAAKCLPSVCPVYVMTPEGEGMGSGVVLDTDGNILTNYHVAGDATEIQVTIAGKEYEATLVGGDASSDLAVVHANLGGDAVTPIEIGDSDTLVVGDWVMTIGSPLGLEQSVSSGIVSSLSRNTLQSSSSAGTTIYANLIQTDAVINPGNSGGALVNEEGQLVGIPTLFSSDTGNYAGVGYAIPGNYAVDIATKIIKGEQVTHAYIGLSMQTVNAQNAASHKLSVDYGAYVAQVAEGGPAAAAGMQEGDIIIAIGDTKITSASDAILAVRSHQIGDVVKVTVMRGSEEKTLDVTLASDEKLQELQQQQLQQQREEQQQYYQELQDYGYGPGGGYSDQEMLEQLYEYLYENHGNSFGQGR